MNKMKNTSDAKQKKRNSKNPSPSIGVQPVVRLPTLEHSHKIINILNKHGYKVSRVTAHYRTLVDIRVECPPGHPE